MASPAKSGEILGEIVSAIANGSAATVNLAGRIADLEDSADAKRDAWVGSATSRGTAAKMAADGIVRRCHGSIEIPIRRALIDVDAVSDSPLHEEHADFIKWALLERCAFWDDWSRRALRKLRDGVSYFEVTDDVVDLPLDRFPNHPGKTTGVAFTGFHDRPAYSIKRTFARADNDAQLERLEQWVFLGDGKLGVMPISGDRILRLTHEQEGGDFWGRPLWRSAMAGWKVKRTLLVLLAIKHERGAVPIPTLELPANPLPDDVRLAEEMLALLNSRERGFVTLPNGFKMTWSDFGEGTNIEDALAFCDRQIAFPFGAGFLLQGSAGGAAGNFAVSYTLEGQHELIVETEANTLCDALTHGCDGWSPVRRLMDLNYGPQHPTPVVVVRNLPTTDWTAAVPAVERLLTVDGMRSDKKLRAFFRRVLRLPREAADAERTTTTAPVGRPPMPGAKPQLNPSDPGGLQ